ncbi:aldo/keto reductase [Jiangella mangrovi]|uniref:Aryl-alcohol dehydrogenase-like predicted oxidoreductase n=1 Tax=Jiangella mangrovi TaxID=1524084 RepID=A0A7W9LPD3_9ACTN|nr:aryl-alcohol dehydrogenase-like predicted oxidoreductase [Jiangella mangrovi]
MSDGVSNGYRQVGTSGLVISELVIGTAAFGKAGRIADGQDGADGIVRAALDLGVTTFDTADSYGDQPGDSETILGRALRGRRDEAVVSTKFGTRALASSASRGTLGSRANVRRAVEDSLRRLGTDWIDLYQIHTPDPATPIEETLGVLDDLVREGKIRYAGASNLPAWRLADAHHVARTGRLAGFVSVQVEYNLLWRAPERDLLPAVRHYGLGLLPYFPLQNGLLTGKYTRTEAPASGKITRFKPHLLESAPWDALDRLHEFAAARSITPIHVAYGWLLAQPGVSGLVTGATTVAQVQQNAAATGWLPTPDEEAELRALLPGELSGKPGRHAPAAAAA